MKKKNDVDIEYVEKKHVANKKNKGTSEKVFVFGLVIVIVILIILLSFTVFSKIDLFNFNKNKDTGKNNDVEIKYSDVATDVNPGIYITDVSEIVENVMPSIVSITSKTLVQNYSYFPWYGNQEYYSTGAGSGIIIAKSNDELLILTNYHVVADTKEIVVSFIDEENVNATIKGFSERKDIAVIVVKLSDIKSETLEKIRIATLGNSDELKVGNGIIAIGNALGYGQSVTVGVVSALNREVSIDSFSNKMIQLDAAINGGNSGGALLNSRGEVVGVNSAKYSSSAGETSVEGMGFAIPISDVNELIESLSNGKGDTNGGKLGISGQMVDGDYNMPKGFYVSGIEEGSGADKSSLEIGNIIVAIDKVEIEDFNDLSNYLYEKKPGDKVTLTVKYISGRSYKEKKIDVTLS